MLDSVGVWVAGCARAVFSWAGLGASLASLDEDGELMLTRSTRSPRRDSAFVNSFGGDGVTSCKGESF